ncbi:hypothetical protein HFO60_18420 [Rhizobium leguminosarum]|nr:MULTISPECIES: hypothetical protein [Rhizobium]MBY3121265.1 hypothetical protein [Rhizobium laguerreae]MBY3191271.1 hypothetical protein [Rhizobium laguerreae]MBY3237072.1 hypothetical protein [Rhizobium laguerreae]MBY5541981.1 hypothetical protein [Rhizobium leguminosarum]MBY5588516.1 hypothetical protein [Rhizobium leguminosarum]
MISLLEYMVVSDDRQFRFSAAVSVPPAGFVGSSWNGLLKMNDHAA